MTERDGAAPRATPDGAAPGTDRPDAGAVPPQAGEGRTTPGAAQQAGEGRATPPHPQPGTGRQPGASRSRLHSTGLRRQPGARPQAGPARLPAPARPEHRREEQTAALKASLAGSEAEAHELREALDELRQVLDAGAAAAAARPAAHRQRRHARAWWLAGALAVLLALLGAALASGVGRDGGRADQAGPAGAPGSGTPAASTTASTPPSPAGSPAASPAAPPPSLRPLPWPGGPVVVPRGLPASGPGVDTPGTDVTVALDPDGRHLSVFERVSFAQPVDRITLTAESVTRLSQGFGRRIEVQVQELQVQLGDVPVPVAAAGSRTYTAALPEGRQVTSAVLRYRLGAGIVRVPSSPPGRHFGVLIPLSAGASLKAGLPVRMRITDRRVVSFTCPTAVDSLCGAREGVTWTASLPPGSTPVALMQVNLVRR